jgi:hypothetical protein
MYYVLFYIFMNSYECFKEERQSVLQLGNAIFSKCLPYCSAYVVNTDLAKLLMHTIDAALHSHFVSPNLLNIYKKVKLFP